MLLLSSATCNILPISGEYVMLTLEEKRKLCSLSVTLDDKPAVIAGARLDFGWVTTLDGRQSVEYSWHAIQHVVTNYKGAFKS